MRCPSFTTLLLLLFNFVSFDLCMTPDLTTHDNHHTPTPGHLRMSDRASIHISLFCTLTCFLCRISPGQRCSGWIVRAGKRGKLETGLSWKWRTIFHYVNPSLFFVTSKHFPCPTCVKHTHEKREVRTTEASPNGLQRHERETEALVTSILPRFLEYTPTITDHTSHPWRDRTSKT